MAFHHHDSRQYVRTDMHLNDYREDFDVPRRPERPLMSQRSLEMYYDFSYGSLLVEGQDCAQGLNIISPPHHPFSDSTSPFYHSPDEELQHPYYSSPATLYNSSSASSDRLTPSIGSRASSLLPSSDPYHIEVPRLDFATYTDGAYDDSSCVAMQHIQKTADMINEEPVDEYNGYGHELQELVPVAPEYYESTPSAYGRQPIPVAYQETCNDSQSEASPETSPDSEADSNYNPDPAPTSRRRRTPKQPPSAITRGHNGVNKRRLPQHPSKPSRSVQDKATTRAFLCPLAPYGCKSTFSAKNEWKRHAITQHFRLGIWRCDQCTESPDRPNDFNRKDLFIQHVRRMHPTNSTTAPETKPSKKKARVHGKVAATVHAALDKIARRCYQLTPSVPQSCCCVFCEEKFEGDGAMESRTEHVGKHMESRRKEGLEPVAVGEWREDGELEGWLLVHGMVVKRKGGGLEIAK